MKASSLSFFLAIAAAVVGMIWGLAMAATQDHSTMPAHAHFNLLGWVSMFLFGIFYHLHPALDRSRHAMIQVLVWAVAVVVMAVGVGLVTSGHTAGEPVAAIGSILSIAGMVFFGVLVARRNTALN